VPLFSVTSLTIPVAHLTSLYIGMLFPFCILLLLFCLTFLYHVDSERFVTSFITCETDISTHLEWPFQEQRGFGITALAPVSGISAPACTNGLWPFLGPVGVAQKNNPSTMFSSNVKPIEFPVDCTASRVSMMRQ